MIISRKHPFIWFITVIAVFVDREFPCIHVTRPFKTADRWRFAVVPILTVKKYIWPLESCDIAGISTGTKNILLETFNDFISPLANSRRDTFYSGFWWFMVKAPFFSLSHQAWTRFDFVPKRGTLVNGNEPKSSITRFPCPSLLYRRLSGALNSLRVEQLFTVQIFDYGNLSSNCGYIDQVLWLCPPKIIGELSKLILATVSRGSGFQVKCTRITDWIKSEHWVCTNWIDWLALLSVVTWQE